MIFQLLLFQFSPPSHQKVGSERAAAWGLAIGWVQPTTCGNNNSF